MSPKRNLTVSSDRHVQKRLCTIKSELHMGISYMCHDADLALKTLKKSLRRIKLEKVDNVPIREDHIIWLEEEDEEETVQPLPLPENRALWTLSPTIESKSIQTPTPTPIPTPTPTLVPTSTPTLFPEIEDEIDDSFLWVIEEGTFNSFIPCVEIVDNLVPVKTQVENLRRVDKDLMDSKIELRHIKCQLNSAKADANVLEGKIRRYNAQIIEKKHEITQLNRIIVHKKARIEKCL